MQQLAPIVLGQEIAQFRQIHNLRHAQLDGGLGEKAFRERQPTFVERQPDGPYRARFPGQKSVDPFLSRHFRMFERCLHCLRA